MWGKEPILIINAVRLVILAVGTFGFAMTEAQLFASMAALEAVLTLFSRSQVTPVAKVEARLTEKQAAKVLEPLPEDKK